MSKNAIVVGATSGIGRGIAKKLSSAGFNVTIVGRNEEQAKIVVQELNTLGQGKNGYIICDAQYVKNGLEFTEKYENQVLDILVLTQGIATLQARTETSEGLDQKMAIHYYGRVAFILGLLPKLQQSSTPKVLSVFAAGVHPPYKDYIKEPRLKNNYSLTNAANACAMYNDIAVDQLSSTPGNENIYFGHIAPGLVNTNWGAQMPWVVQMLMKPIKPFLRSIDTCADYMCRRLLG
jgi:NAD(P)-dependent dehydrogenase (short-subunit alcohol dehydrogenase family)